MEAELGIYRRPLLCARAATLRARVYGRVAPLEAWASVSDEPVAFEDRLSLPMRRMRPGESWGRAFSTAWFRLSGAVPAPFPGGHLVAVADLSGEGLVVDGEGRALAGIADRMAWVDGVQPAPGKKVIELGPGASAGEPVELWIEAGYNGSRRFPPFGASRFRGAHLAIRRDELAELYYDYLVLAFASAACEEPRRRREIDGALAAAWRELGSGGYGGERIAAARALLGRAMRETECGGAPAYEAGAGLGFTAVGHSHLDLAWLWPIRETKRKAARTFANALNNLERYPEYAYGASQPQQFAWIKEGAFELWPWMKAAVASGRLELQGGMWVEPDCNLASGESLVRQLLYGTRFFEREFGERMRICWLPDAFGFNGNLPQILKKSGIDYFLTIKLSWNEVNAFPYRSFVWKGIDGSSVLAHMPPEGDYNSGATPLCVKRAAERYPERAAAGEGLVLFGAGDGGGGPGEAHIELARRQRGLAGFPPLRPGRAIDFFDRLAAKAASLPEWRGELYLEKHQGTYTTQGRSKRANRAIEALLHELECLATAAWLRGRPYPGDLLERVWKEALLYQFHDILPGSSIGRVYDESLARYAILTEELEGELAAASAFLASGAGGPAPAGAGASWANLAPFARSGWVKEGGRWFSLEASPYATARALPADGPFPVSCGEGYLENDRLRATFSRGGELASLLDKETGAESVGAYANRLVLYSDPWRYFNAWDINPRYPSMPRKILRAVSTESFLDGPRAIRRCSYRHGRTTLVQDAILEAGKPILEFETRCEWRETFRMLRADFAPAAFGDRAAFDIQFGSIERSTREDDPVAKAQFEVCAHKWVDVSEGGRGLSLLNDCKYGHRVKSGLLSLNLLRSPVYPDPRADRGEQSFRYALYPHGGDAHEGGTAREAYLFNIRPRRLPGGAIMPSLASTTSPNVVIETIKKAEDEEAVVLRLYENAGRATVSSLALGFEARELVEADMLERPAGPADPAALSFGPFETKTLIARLP